MDSGVAGGGSPRKQTAAEIMQQFNAVDESPEEAELREHIEALREDRRMLAQEMIVFGPSQKKDLLGTKGSLFDQADLRRPTEGTQLRSAHQIRESDPGGRADETTCMKVITINAYCRPKPYRACRLLKQGYW